MDGKCVINRSVGFFLSQRYPEFYSLFFSYKCIIVPTPVTIPDRYVAELRVFSRVPAKTKYAIYVANRLMENEIDPYWQTMLYRYKLCFVPHLLRLQSSDMLVRTRIVEPNFYNAINTGILPEIPFHLTRLIFDNGNDYYGGSHVTHLKMWGIAVEYCFNKVMRQACKKRRRAKQWKTLFLKHRSMWALMVDIFLLYIVLGVYDHKKAYPNPYFITLDTACAAAMMARHMLDFSKNEMKAWIDRNQNLMVLAWCAYIYDQIDNLPDLSILFYRLYNHDEYNFKMKEALIMNRCGLEAFLQPMVISHFNSSTFQTPQILKAWNVHFKRMDDSCKNWYGDTKQSKYSPTISCHQIYLMLQKYYRAEWNRRRKQQPQNFIGEKKCFIPVNEERHPWLLQLAVWTVQRGMMLPMYDLLALMGFPHALLTMICSIPSMICTEVSWKKTIVDNMDFILSQHFHLLPDIIWYTFFCWELGELKVTRLPDRITRVQMQRVQSKSSLPFALDEAVECSTIRFCRGCVKPKNCVIAAPRESPFFNLASMDLAPIERRRTELTLRKHMEFGSPKQCAVRIEDMDMTCNATSIVKNEFQSNPLCRLPVIIAPVIGFEYQLPLNIHISICMSCGNRCQYASEGTSGGDICCSQCVIKLAPKLQAILASEGFARHPHYRCNVKNCFANTSELLRFFDTATLQFWYCAFCDHHYRIIKIKFSSSYNCLFPESLASIEQSSLTHRSSRSSALTNMNAFGIN